MIKRNLFFNVKKQDLYIQTQTVQTKLTTNWWGLAQNKNVTFLIFPTGRKCHQRSKIESIFLSPAFSISTPYVSYLLFNVQSKEKILLAQIFCFSFYGAMPILNANIRIFNLYVGLPNNFYFLACMCICIIFLPEQQKPCTKLIQLFLFQFLMHTPSTHTLQLQLTDH